MIAPALNIVDNLGAIISAGAPSPAVDSPDFAAILSTMTTGDVDAVRQPAFMPLIPNEPMTSAPVPVDAERTDLVEHSPIESVSSDAKDLSTLPGEMPMAEFDRSLVVATNFIEHIDFAVSTVGPHAPLPLKRAAISPATKTAPRMAIEPQIAVAAPVVPEHVKRSAKAAIEKSDLSVVPTADCRSVLLMPILEKPTLPMPERGATFAPVIADAVRDLAAMAQDKDLRFNVRPEALGPVAVTIERSDSGPTLRLGVETHAAVQAVRQAEPMLNDARGHLPFLHVTVDMNAPDSRGRSPKNMLRPAPTSNEGLDHGQLQPYAPTGRFA